jgi:hypothetical protein
MRFFVTSSGRFRTIDGNSKFGDHYVGLKAVHLSTVEINTSRVIVTDQRNSGQRSQVESLQRRRNIQLNSHAASYSPERRNNNLRDRNAQSDMPRQENVRHSM